MRKRVLQLLTLLTVLLMAVSVFGCTEADQDLAIKVLAEALQQSVVPSSSPSLELDSVPASTQVPVSAQINQSPTVSPKLTPSPSDGDSVIYGNDYSTPEEVAEYLHVYGELPPNYITKQDAMDLGWDSYLGNLYEVTGGLSIGGDRYSNYERSLPTKKGRIYYECDVNYYGGYRGGERLVYSNDGLIYYTSDHYSTFQLIYGE